MLDVRLGLVCWIIRAIVLGYVIGYVFLLGEGYTTKEQSVGKIISSVNGSSFSVTTDGEMRVWDAIDLATPALEDGAAFIATSIDETLNQYIANYTDITQSCASNSDCLYDPPLSYGVCDAGFCQMYGWTAADAPVTHAIKSSDTLGVWLRASIQFPTLDETRMFSTMDVTAPTMYDGGAAAGAVVAESSDSSTTLGEGGSGGVAAPDFYTVGELLSLAGTSYETIQATGCTLSVTFIWSCFTDNSADCVPQIQVTRMDMNEMRKGFGYSYAHYYTPVAQSNPPDPSLRRRDLFKAKGVRLLITSLGEGKALSISVIMLQISSGIALLWLAGFAADFLMLHVLPEKKHYRTYKQERTPDFSDLRNKINEVEGEKKKLRDRKNRFAKKLDET